MVGPVRRCGKCLLWVLAGWGALVAIALAGGIVWRLPLAAWALRHALAGTGIELRDVRITSLGLHHATAGPLDLAWRGQQLHLDSVTIDRPDLFSSSLGRVVVQGLTLELDLACLPPPAAATVSSPPTLPRFDDLAIAGRLVLHAPGAEAPVAFAFTAQPDGAVGLVRATADLAGPSFHAQGELDYDLTRSTGSFRLGESQVDLAGSRGWLEPLLPAAMSGWQLAGTVRLSASGQFAPGRMDGQMELHWRNGAVKAVEQHLSFAGIQADIVLSDLANLATPPGQKFSMEAAHVGDLTLQNLAVRFQAHGVHRLQVEAAEGVALGGAVSTEPFEFDPAVIDYGLTLRFAGVRVADVMALFPSARATATGVAEGQVLLHYGARGLSFGRGWLTLRAGTTGTLQLDEPGLLTAGLAPGSMAYSTLKAVETGLLNLQVDALRAEIYPPDAPPGRSVQIHIEGRPLDPTIKAPVTFDVNVNGPVEKLIQWGLDSRMNFAPK